MRASTELTAGVCVNVGESVRVCFLSGGRCLRGILRQREACFCNGRNVAMFYHGAIGLPL